MKDKLQELVRQALQALEITEQAEIQITRAKNPEHGDWATNIALMLAKKLKTNPIELAEKIVDKLDKTSFVRSVSIAKPGFINFFINEDALYDVIPMILEQKENYGKNQQGQGKKIHLEFVSANPTGPLHVGHGRGAAYGSVVANLLENNGYFVHREYYVNDAGRQMDILATSIWWRYLQKQLDLPFPSNGYKGNYVQEIADKLQGDFLVDKALLLQDLPQDEPEGGDKEIYIDALIAKAKSLLQEKYDTVFNLGLQEILNDIKDDLQEFEVTYQNWYSEKSLVENQAIEKALEKLKPYLYEKDGALWFKATEFEDEKDRVVRRENGAYTYFASDIAYHYEKFEKGYDKVIDIWGADHHGYIPRVRAALQALGIAQENLEVLLVQFASLYRSGEKVQMSTRLGSFVTLRELRDEVGKDAARFFYVMRKAEQHMDFDLDLAVSKDKDNPVYYSQYTYARISSIFRKLTEQGWEYQKATGLKHLALLKEPKEIEIVNQLTRYPEVVKKAAINAEPQQLTNYLYDFSQKFHSYYNEIKVLVEDENLRNARLTLSLAIQQVIKNAFHILEIQALEEM